MSTITTAHKPFSFFFRYRFPVIAWAITIFLASSIPSMKFPKFQILSFDKVLHIGVFFVFGILMYRAFEPKLQTMGISWKRLLFSCALTIVYGITDEVHQGFVPGRHVDKYDIIADAIGAFLAMMVMFVYVWRSKRRKQQKTI